MVRIPGVKPLALHGNLIIGKDNIGFNNVKLADLINIEGVVYKKEDSRLKVWTNKTSGEELEKYIPELFRPFVSSHSFTLDMSFFGKMNNLNAGGQIVFHSEPIQIVCRYRSDKFSFRSLSKDPIRISGSIDIKDDCNGCIFQSSDWTTERKTAFLEWEKEQREG